MKKLPEEFCAMINGLACREPRVGGLLESLSRQEPVVAIRVNPRKPHPDIVDVAGVSPVKWWRGGVYLPERPSFTLDVALHQGRYYVQDPSSMFIGHVVEALTSEADAPLVYLDACAAPGGKTTAAIDALPEGSLVVANEYDFRRAEILNENLTKWGYPGVVVARGDTSRFSKLNAVFDIIAADVPCSGEGMMRKDDDAVAQWTPALVEQCAGRQREIIDNLWPALKPGGYFIYSTCTFNLQENEQIVEYLIDNYDAESVGIPGGCDFPEIVPAIASSRVHAARFMPHQAAGEGLFMAVLRKPGSLSDRRPQKPVKPPKIAFNLPGWFPRSLEPLVEGDTLYALPGRWTGLVNTLRRHLDIIRAGVDVATVKGRDLVPSHGVAMLSTGDVKAGMVEVDTATALDYLRREAVSLPDGTPRGFLMLTYQGAPLGWIKNLGNRANNLYPQPWRIRHL